MSWCQKTMYFLLHYIIDTCIRLYVRVNLTLLEPKVIKHLPPGQSQASLHICAVWPGSVLLAGQLQILILLSTKLIINSSTNGRWTSPFNKFVSFSIKKFHLSVVVILSSGHYTRWRHNMVINWSFNLPCLIVPSFIEVYC